MRIIMSLLLHAFYESWFGKWKYHTNFQSHALNLFCQQLALHPLYSQDRLLLHAPGGDKRKGHLQCPLGCHCDVAGQRSPSIRQQPTGKHKQKLQAGDGEGRQVEGGEGKRRQKQLGGMKGKSKQQREVGTAGGRGKRSSSGEDG